MFVCEAIDGEETFGKQFTYPELLGLAFFIVLEFVHIFLEFLYLGLGGGLFFLGSLYGFLEVSYGLFGRFNIISDL